MSPLDEGFRQRLDYIFRGMARRNRRGSGAR